MLIANASGIFGVYSYREVFEFDRFWGIGSGRSFALGAMYAVYDKAEDGARKWPRPACAPAANSTRTRPGRCDVHTHQARKTATRHAAWPDRIKVPDIGDFKDVAVIEVLVKPGDTVKAEQSLITVESDKASMEIPSRTPAS